jgi:hypothetical protein
MKNNVIALPVGRIRRNTPVNRRVQAIDQDLYVNMVESDPGHIARRQARRDAYYAAKAQAQEDADRLLFNVGTFSMFATLAALVGWGLWL